MCNTLLFFGIIPVLLTLKIFALLEIFKNRLFYHILKDFLITPHSKNKVVKVSTSAETIIWLFDYSVGMTLFDSLPRYLNNR